MPIDRLGIRQAVVFLGFRQIDMDGAADDVSGCFLEVVVEQFSQFSSSGDFQNGYGAGGAIHLDKVASLQQPGDAGQGNDAGQPQFARDDG